MGRKGFKFFGIEKVASGISKFLTKQWFKLTLFLVVVLSGLAIQRSIYADPTFGLRFVDIQTTGVLDKDQIVQWSGIKPGTNIFDINLKAVEHRLLRHPEVKSVRLTRNMPNRIGLFISERRIFLQAVAGEKSAEFWSMDEEGFVIPSPSNQIRLHLPVLMLPELSKHPLEIGMQYLDPQFKKAKELISAIYENDFLHFEDISYIATTAQDEFEIKLRSGVKVYVKENFDAALKKLSHFQELFKADTGSIEYIDARFNDVAVKRKK